MSDLKPCPHCGNPVKQTSMMIICDECAMGVTFASGDNRQGRQFLAGEKLAAAWNTRPVAVASVPREENGKNSE